MEIFVLLFTILYAILAWRKLDLATAFLIVALPVYQIRFNIGFLPVTLLEIMILVLFIIWFIQGIKNKEIPLFNPRLKNIKSYPFWKEIMAILVIAFIAMLVAGSNNSALGILKAYFIEPIMFFIVFINIFKIKENRPAFATLWRGKNKVFWALAISALIISIVAIYQKITGQFIPVNWADSGRVTGVFAYPNAVGLYLGPIVILLGGFLISILKSTKFQILNSKEILNFKFQTCLPVGKVLKSIFVVLSVICSIVAIYLAQSEGALIGILVAGFIFGLLYNKKSRQAVIGLMIVGIMILGFNSDLRHEVVKKVTLMDKDGQIRRQLWSETWQMLTDNPRNFIFGAGLANYQNAIVPYHQSGIYVRNDDPEFDKMVKISLEYQQQVWQPLEIYLYPHNILLNFWSELGLAGVLLFTWIIGKFLVIGLKIKDSKYKALVLGLTCAMIVVVIHGLVDAPYFKNDLAILFWMLIAMMGILNLENKEK